MTKFTKTASGLALTAVLILSAAIPALAASPYEDVPEDAWYGGAADFCRTYGLMNGASATAFNPGGAMTRGQIVTVLHRLAGSPQAAAPAAFSDVPEDFWCADAIAWAVQAGIAGGYSDGRFGPNDPVSREQLAIFLWRYSGSPVVQAEDYADEADISPAAVQAADWARASGVLSGKEGNLFAPKDSAVRSQAAVILQRYTSRYGVYSGAVSMTSAMDIMCEPSGIAEREDGSLLVTDTYHRLIWLVEDGVSSVYAGGETPRDPYGQPMGGYNDAALERSYFRRPWAIAPFLDGWAVSDADNNVVRLVRPAQTETVNGRTEEKLQVTNMGVAFSYPTGLAADGDGNLYISDTGGGAVRRVTPKGVVTTVADDLTEPMGLCWTEEGLYIAEAGANRIVRLVGKEIQVVAGSGQEGRTDGPAAEASFTDPQGVAVGDDGTVYVADTGSGAVRQVKNGQVITLAARDWKGMESCPVSPVGLLVREDGLYVCDNFARRVFVLPLG